MTTTTISGSTTATYVITSASSSTIEVTQSGVLEAGMPYAVAIYSQLGVVGTVINYGRIGASAGIGVSLNSGGMVVNGSVGDQSAYITGGNCGVWLNAQSAGTVLNYGTISAPIATAYYSGIAVSVLGDARVINGSAADTHASILGNVTGIRALGTAVSVQNFGTVAAYGSVSYGVYLRDGGSVVNGSVHDTSALINGYYLGIETTTKGVSVVNYGTIESFSTVSDFGRALNVTAGGTVINGSTLDTSARLIGESTALYIHGPSNNGSAGFSRSEALNFGTIQGIQGSGIYIRIGQQALVVNGSAGDTTALIEGARNGVEIQSFSTATVCNYGTITGGIGYGINLMSAGIIRNGSAADNGALISDTGPGGVTLGGISASTVTNYGTIEVLGTTSARAVMLYGNGTIANGSTADRAASILGGGIGVSLVLGNETLINYGTILSAVGVSFYRVVANSTLTGSGTVINSGTIASTSGNSGIAIRFGTGDERLVVDPGATFLGKVIGGSGNNTLELARGGTGKLYGLGSMLTNFGTVVVDSGAYWLLEGSNTLAANVTLLNVGTLIDAGSLLVQGSVSYNITVAAGATLINGGTIGADGSAATFGSGGLLVIDPGAVFLDGVTAAGDTGLELAKGISPGTLGGLGSAYSGFRSVVVDPGAYWTLTGTNTLLGGVSLTNSGTLVVTGALTNYGSIGGAVTVASGGTLVNRGTLGGSGATNGLATTIAAGGHLVIDPGGAFVGRVTGAAGSKLDLAAGGQGTLTGFGVSLAGFTSVTVDDGASWTLAGYSRIAAGVSVYNTGTLIASGTMVNKGYIDARLTIAAGTTLENFGTLGGGNAVTTFASGSILQLEAGSAILGRIAGNAGATLELASFGSGSNVLYGLGSTINNFGTVVVYSATPWTLAGANTLSSGATLITSASLIVGGDLLNQGSISGIISVASGATLETGGVLGGNGTTSGWAATVASSGKLVLDPGETFIGHLFGTSGATLELAGGGSAVLAGLGSVVTGFGSVVVDKGASWTMTGNNTVASGTGLTVAGTLVDAGILIDAGTILGPVTVAAGATLAVSGVLATSGPMTTVASGGLLTVNPGAVLGSVLGSAGSTLELTNGSAGTLSGLGVSIAGFGTVKVDRGPNWTFAGTNTVAAGTSLAVSTTIADTGTLTVAGIVSGSVTVANGATLIDRGTLGFGGATNSTAASVAAGGRLVLAPGAAVVGRLLGGGSGSILELASGGSGTLTGLGSSITNFGSLTVDSGATWALAGASTIAVGTTLTNTGVLTASGSLNNSGSIAGQLTVAAGATLANNGTIGVGGTAVTFAGGGGLLQVGSSGAFNGTVLGGGSTRMELLGGSAGTLSGLNGNYAGTATNAGRTWSFSGIDSLKVDQSASWALNGPNTLSTANGVTVAGTLAASGALVLTGAGTLATTGGAARLLAGGGLTLQGATLAPSNGGVVEIGAAGSSVASAVVIDAGRTLSGFGTIAGSIADTGVLLVQGGALTVTGHVNGAGGVTLASGATLIAQDGLNEASLVFGSGGSETLQIAKSMTVGAAISGFGSSDVIDFLGTVATTMTFTGGHLKLIGAGGTIANLALTGSYTSGNFAFASDGRGGTDLSTVGLPAQQALRGAGSSAALVSAAVSPASQAVVHEFGGLGASAADPAANTLLGFVPASH